MLSRTYTRNAAGRRGIVPIQSAVNGSKSKRPHALRQALGSVVELLEERRLLSTTIFKDDYSTDTSANYVQQDQGGATNTWTIANGTLNYNVSATNGWNSSVFLLKPSVANTGGLFQFAVSGDLIKGGDPVTGINLQPGLIISGDTTNGGFVVMEYDNGAFANHLVLLQETGAQLIGDEGGVGNPPVLADFGDISMNLEDTFHVVANVDRTGANPVFNITITDLTTPSFTIAPQTITDTNVPSSYGGTQIGWRARYDTVPAGDSYDNLELDNTIASADHAPAAPTIGTPTYAKGAVTITFTDNADNETGFSVERSTDGVNFSSIGLLGPLAGTGATGTFVDTNVKPNTTYTYRVGAVNGFMGGTTSESGTKSITTPIDFPGWVYSGYGSDTQGGVIYNGDSANGVEQLAGDGKKDEGQAPAATAVLSYQEILSHVIDFSGNNAVLPPDAPANFNIVQGAGNQGSDFALRFSGIFTPTVTGYYTLGISTDDGGAAAWANPDGSNPVSLTPVSVTPPPPDNLTAARGNTLDVDPVVDANGNPVQWIAGQQYEIQFDQNNQGGGWDVHAYYAISSTVANQMAADAGTAAFDVKGQTLMSPGDITPPVPAFKTVDLANPNGLAKDNSYYMGNAAGGDGVVELTFNNIAADYYNVYRATAAGGTYTKINAAPVMAHTGLITYDDTGVTNGTPYFYIVTGVNVAGETAQANGLHLTATPAVQPPGAPVLNSATVGAVSGISPLTFNVNLSWNPVSFASSYSVFRGTTAGGEGATPIATGITGTSYSDPNASPNSTYFYVVQAVNTAGSSPNSNEVSVKLGTVGLPAVANAVTEHFYDSRYWGSNDQSTNGYQTPALIGHSVTAPYVDGTGNKAIDLHGDDGAASALPPNGDIKDNFSTIFSGQLHVVAGGSYTFNANTDDDGYLVVDGQIVATNPGGHGPQEGNAFPITLASNATYDFQFYQANGGGGWDWHMEWTGPDSGGSEAIVPIATSPTTSGIVNSTEDVPADPTNGALAVNGKNVNVTWTDNAVSELEYVLQRSTDPTFATNDTTMVLPFVENKGGAAAQGSFTDSGLANGTYYYRLQAVNFDGASKILNLGSATVGGGGAQDVITGTPGNDAITLKQDMDGTDIDWTMGAQSGKLPINDPKGLTINGNGGTDTITFDNSNGNPLPNLLVLNQTGAGSEFVIQGLQAVAAGQKVDIQNSKVQWNYTGASPLSTIQGYLKGGQVFSSTLAANPKFAIADDDSADPLNTGQPANTILLRPAIIGNATLSGKVGFNDFVQLARNYGKNNADWAMGDFNYDGNVGFDDLVGLARNYNQSGPAATAAATLSASIIPADDGLGKKKLSSRKH